MQIKYFLYSIVAVTLALTLTACPEETAVSNEAGFTYFGIPNQNGFIDFENKFFSSSADSIDGYYEVTNDKPFPYGGLDDSLKFTFGTYSNNIVFTTKSFTDTLGIPFDSTIQAFSNSTYLYFKPDTVIFEVYAPDLSNSKKYKIIISEDSYNPDKVNWKGPSVLAEIPFNPEGFYQSYSLDSTVFVLYGMPNETSGVIQNNLYSSKDGKSWNEHSLTEGAYPAGIYHAISKQNEKFICFSSLQMNEAGEYVPSSDIWTSVDGISWQKETSGLPIGKHAFHSIKNLNGTLYAFGGTEVINGQTSLNNALYLTDTIYGSDTTIVKVTPAASRSIYAYNGSTWTVLNDQTPEKMPSRFMASSYAKGRIYTVNGELSGSHKLSTDVWATETGDYWLRTGNNTTPALAGATLANFNPYLWRIGGMGETDISPIITETVDDGASWFDVTTESRPDAAPPVTIHGRYNQTTIVDDYKRLWIIGGTSASGSLKEVWIATKN